MRRVVHSVTQSALPARRCFHASALFRSATDTEAERVREAGLRAQITAKYPNLKLAPVPEFHYAQYHGSANAASSSAQQDTSGGSGSRQQSPQQIDWLMLLTGTALVYISSDMLAERLKGPAASDTLGLPIWCLPYDQQARYLLFTVSADKFVRNQLQQEFSSVRAHYPLLSFFDWLDQRYPGYGCGRRYPRQTAVDLVTSVLQRGTNFQLAAFGRVCGDAIATPGGGDPQGRVDLFLEKVEKIGVMPLLANTALPAGGLFGLQPPLAPPGYPATAAPTYSSTASPVTSSGPVMAYVPPTVGYSRPTDMSVFPSNPANGYPPLTHSTQHGGQDVTLADVLSSVQGSAPRPTA